MTVLYIGNHTSSSKGYAAMARQIIKNEGNTFAFFTRNPRGGKAKAIDETERRRRIQQKYNEEHGITPTTIKKAVRDLIAISKAVENPHAADTKDPESMDEKELKKLAKELEKKMRQAAAELNFEEAANLRDRMIEVKKMLLDICAVVARAGLPQSEVLGIRGQFLFVVFIAHVRRLLLEVVKSNPRHNRPRCAGCR